MKTAVKERPLAFTQESVAAILAGSKTQTRRLARPPARANFLPDDVWKNDPDEPGSAYLDDSSGRLRITCPYGVPGDRLWVRETYRAVEDPGAPDEEVRRRLWDEEERETTHISVDYKLDNPHRIMDKLGRPEWKSGRYMPRWASRIDLEVTGVRVERVQEITEADATAEGVRHYFGLLDGRAFDNHMKLAARFAKLHDPQATTVTAVDYYAAVWERLHGAGAWKRNDWIWVVDFKFLTAESWKASKTEGVHTDE